MSILDFKGKAATPGLPVLYHLTSGQIFYSESVREDGDSFIFDGDTTLLLSVHPGSGNGNRQVNISMMKFSDGGFKSKQARVLKSSVVMVTDIGEPALISKAHEALSGLVLPTN